MQYRTIGNTGLKVSEIGFGCGNNAVLMVKAPYDEQVQVVKRALDAGINFFDTADFYGLGHSEELLGKIVGNRSDIVMASKVGHRLDKDQKIYTDYAGHYIMQACEDSLKRLKREQIDFYQLHTARVSDFTEGSCIEAMERLREQGKIRYWGVSLNTFHPEPEADYIFQNKIGDGLQLVFNVINQKAKGVINRASEEGYGVIARMPLQFGLLTGKFSKESRFDKNDHRAFRLVPELLFEAIDALENAWKIAEKQKHNKTSFSLSFITSYPGVSTVIPGIKTPEQAVANCTDIRNLEAGDMDELLKMYDTTFKKIVELMKKLG